MPLRRDRGCAADETDGIGPLPLLMATRAVIRAHVTAVQAEGADDADIGLAEARAYLDLARGLLADAPAALLAVGGFSGSGKSSVAAAAAPWIGPAPGARILSSDRIRKRLHGVSALTRLPDSAYGPAASERVHATLRQEAGRVLAAGHAAVADAVFDRPAERAAIETVAIEAVAGARGARFCGVWLEAPAADLGRRIAARTGGPSGATAAAQVARGSGSVAWHRLAADRPLPALSADVLFLCARLGATGLAPPAISPAPIRRVPAD